VKICPAECIKLDATNAYGKGAPYIDPDAMPCVLCDGLLCMNVCPTGALQPTPLVLVDMGTAEWRPDACLRSRGEPCTICIDQCPIGTKAIDLVSGAITVFSEGCTGCGVCQNHCPTSPKSIVVIPKSAR
jgi:ferredoxin-type protein NapG